MLIVLTLFLSTYSRANAQSAPVMTDINENARHDVILEVDLNGQRSSLLARFREQEGHLWASGQDLNTIGLATDRLGIADTAEIQLDSIRGLRYTYDVAHQAVNLEIADDIRKPYTLDSRSTTAAGNATSSRGVVINYDAFAQMASDEQLALYSEQRYFDPVGVFTNTGIMQMGQHAWRYMRYDTSWSRSDPAIPSTTQIGDTISSSLTWTRSVRIAGFQWRSNFALRPDLVTFPVPAFAGSVAVPSAVDLYVNSVRQFSANVPNGPFVINGVTGITGAGEATVITHDALGRTITTSVPLYIDSRLLAPGLSSYSFEAGFLRRNYGLNSFDYDRLPAASASVRRGLTDALTVEGHAEVTPGLVNAGVGGLVRLHTAGVVNGSLSASAGSLTGAQVSLGYQLIGQHFSLDAQTTRAFGHYGDLASHEGTAVPSTIDQVTLSLPIARHQTLAVSYIAFRLPQEPASKIGSVSYTVNMGKFGALNLSAHRDFAQRNASGVFVTLSFGLDHNASVSSTFGRQAGQSTYSASALRPSSYAGGWGWGVQAGGGASAYRQAQLQYLGHAGEVTAIAQNTGSSTSASLDVSGALVLMDGSAQPSRRIYDGFALVSTDGVAGLPVLHDNRVIGTTDGSGHLLVPDLNAYQSNRIGIDSTTLPADTRIESTTIEVVPQAQSGVLAHFGVSRYSAASIILGAPDGTRLPPGSRVHHLESGRNTIVGYDGLAFIDDLQPENHLVIDTGTLHCQVNFQYVRPSNGTLPTIGPLTCSPDAGDMQ